MAYKTEDGRIFNFESDAQAHANNLAASEARSAANIELGRNAEYHAMFLIVQQIERELNAGNWTNVINIVAKEEDVQRFFNAPKLCHLYPVVWYYNAIALANRDNNYNKAFFWAGWTKQYDGNNENCKKVFPSLFEAGKKAWERVNGRAMTDADLAKAHIDYLEKDISEYVSENGFLSEYSAEKWEKATGRKMTKEDMIRIAGKTFKIGKGSSSTSTSSGDQRGVFLSIVFGLVCGLGSFLTLKMIFDLLSGNGVNIISIGALIVGFIITFIAWRYKNNVLFILMLVISVIGYLNLFGFIGNKTPKPQTTQSVTITQQADITQNVNFRKDPSTGDNIIRQLKKGDTVTLTGEVVEGWTQITHDGDTGWVSSEFLKVWGK
jgi:hypothetical protein